MTTDVDFADTQAYLRHFRSRGCDTAITDNTEGLFNLCWFTVGLIDELKQELKRKTVNIVRLQEIIFGAGAIAETPDNDGDADTADTTPGANEQTPAEEDEPPASHSETQATEKERNPAASRRAKAGAASSPAPDTEPTEQDTGETNPFRGLFEVLKESQPHGADLPGTSE